MDHSINPWKVLEAKDIYENPWIKLTEFDVLNPNGGKGIYGKVHFKNLAIGILALNENKELAMVGQFRFPINQYSWEIPEGGGDLLVDPIESAKRELLEETGLKAQLWTKILEMHLSNSVSDEFGLVFLAEQLSQHDAEPEDTEQLQIRWVPFQNVFEEVMENKITDSLTVAGILKLKLLRPNI